MRFATPMTTPLLSTSQIEPDPALNQQLADFMRGAVLRSAQDFSCQGVPLTPDMLSQENGFLPLWMFMAGEKLDRLWGPQSLIFHEQEAGTLLQVRLGTQRAMLPTSLWYHALHLVLEEAVDLAYAREYDARRRSLQEAPRSGKTVVLDHIVDAWDLAISERRVTFAPTPASAALPSAR